MKLKKRLKRVLLYAAVILVVIWTMAPLLWMFISSIIPVSYTHLLRSTCKPHYPGFCHAFLLPFFFKCYIINII